MALPTATLPAVPTGMSAADPDIQKQYSESIDKVLAALENRGGTNWAKIAAAMANPGRTGNWSEGFANAMGVIGQQREEEEKNALPIAQMRASLVGQKYEMEKQAKAMESLQAMTGGTPQMIATTDLPMIAKTLNLAEDDPKLVQLVGQPKAPFMIGTGQSVIGVTAQPTFTKDEVNQAMIASKYDPSGAMKMLFERQTKWNEPGTMQKDIAYAMNPNTPPLARNLALQKITIDAQKLNLDIAKLFVESGYVYPGTAPPKSSGDPNLSSGLVTGARSTPTTTTATPTSSGSGGGGSSTGMEAVQIPAIFGADINAAVTTNFRAGHYGVDFAVPSGTPMAVPTDSTVVAAGSDPRSGNYISFKGADGYTHTVAHLSEALITTGDKVPMGTNFGLVGSTGNSTGPHAHWVIKDPDGKPVDPIKYFGISGGAPAATTTAATPAASGWTMSKDGKIYIAPDGVPLDLSEIKSPKIQQELLADAQKRYAERSSVGFTKKSEAQAEADVKEVTNLRTLAKTASNVVTLADNQLSLIKNNPVVFGYLNDSSASSAILRAIKSASVANANLAPDEIARYLKGSVKEQDLDTVAMFINNATQLNLNFARISYANQGAVTESERSYINTLAGSPSESPTVLRLKAQAYRTSAQRDMDIHQAYLDFEQANPRKNYNDFLRSNSFKQIKTTYEQLFTDFRKNSEQLLRAKPATPSTGGGGKNTDRLRAITGD